MICGGRGGWPFGQGLASHLRERRLTVAWRWCVGNSAGYFYPFRPNGLRAAAVVLSAGLHVLLLAFNTKSAPVRAAAPVEVVEVRLELPAPEPEEAPVQEIAEAAESAGSSMPVPTLMDIPSAVPVDAFVLEDAA